MIVVSCSISVYADINIDKNSIKGEVSDPDISVEATENGNAIVFEIINNSEETMKNVHLISRETNKMVSDETCKSLGNIDSGKSLNTTILVKSMNSYFRGISDWFGGFINFYIVVLLVFAVILVIILKVHKKVSIRVFCGLTVFILIVLAFTLYSSVTSKEYKTLDTGNNYIRTISVDSRDGCSLEYYLKYNQDDTTYTYSDKDVDINFDTIYEYDEDVPCTDKPVIKTEGKRGKKHIKTTIKYRNGVKEDEKTEEVVISKPENQVEVQGTKTTVEIQNIDAKKEYIPDDTMKVGDYKLATELADSRGNIGKKEVTYTWNKSENKIEKSEKVTKKPGTNIWRAGSLVINEEVISAKTNYIVREDQVVGWENVIKESVDGTKTTIYKTEIDKTTGKPKKGIELKYYATLKEEPINGEKEVGVLSIEEEVTEREVVYSKDDSKWDNEEIVTAEGQDKVEKVTKVMKFDRKKGTISDTVDREISRELIQNSIKKEVVRGTRKPNWVEEKKATGQVKYNTVYVPDKSLSGDEQQVEVKGEMGRLITTQLIAVDENGNRLTSYQPKIIEEDSLQKPVDEVIHVAPDSKLLK